MHQADLATSKREDVPAFLRHLAILLTRGTDDDKEAKHVIAVTEIISESTCSVKSLVVAQNSPNARRVNSSERFHLGIKSVKGKSQPVDEIYKRYGQVPSYCDSIVCKGLSTNIHAESIGSEILLKTSANTSKTCLGSSARLIPRMG